VVRLALRVQDVFAHFHRNDLGAPRRSVRLTAVLQCHMKARARALGTAAVASDFIKEVALLQLRNEVQRSRSTRPCNVRSQ